MQSKAKQSQRPCCRLNEPINQSIQSSLRVSYPILQPNHLQPMHGRVISLIQVSQSNERKEKRLMLVLVFMSHHHWSCFVIFNSLTLSASKSNMPIVASWLGPFFLDSLALSECTCLWISAN